MARPTPLSGSQPRGSATRPGAPTRTRQGDAVHAYPRPDTLRPRHPSIQSRQVQRHSGWTTQPSQSTTTQQQRHRQAAASRHRPLRRHTTSAAPSNQCNRAVRTPRPQRVGVDRIQPSRPTRCRRSKCDRQPRCPARHYRRGCLGTRRQPSAHSHTARHHPSRTAPPVHDTSSGTTHHLHHHRQTLTHQNHER